MATQSYAQVLKGLVTLDGSWFANGGPAPIANSVTMEWLVDNAPMGSGYITGPPFVWALDTTKLADGTHTIGARFIDSTDPKWTAYQLRTLPMVAVVMNVGPVSGAQRVPSVGLGYNKRIDPPMPDYVQYPGTLPLNNKVHPYPVQVIAPSSDPSLRDSTKWYCEALTELTYGEYESSPHWYTTPKGGVFIEGYLPQTGIILDDSLYQGVIRHLNYDGGRNDNMVDPYSNAVEFPDGSGWAAADLGGRICKIAHDGTVTTIAGAVANRSVLPYDYRDFTITEDQVFSKSTVLGTLSGFGDFHGINDLCFDPRNANILYAVKTFDHCVIRVDLSVSPPACSLYAGQDGVAGYVDGPIAGSKLNTPTSICMTGDGILHIADNKNSAIRDVSPDGLTMSTLVGGQTVPDYVTVATNFATYSPPGTVPFASAFTAYPFVLRPTSTDNLILGEITCNQVRFVNRATKTITLIGAFAGQAISNTNNIWFWLAIDTKGTCGPVDDIVCFSSDAQGSAAMAWRLSIDGTYSKDFVSNMWDLSDGPAPLGSMGFHYPWLIEFSKHEGRFIMSGFARQGIQSYRILQPSDPPYDWANNVGIDPPTFRRGKAIWDTGTIPIFPWGARPSFRALMGSRGVGHLGVFPTLDDLVVSHPDSASLLAYVQAGMGGTVARPEITGNDWRDLEYYMRRTALGGGTVVPGPDNPDKTPPVISNVVAKRMGPTSAVVTWTTDKATLGLAAAGTSVYNVWSDIEPIYGTAHSVTLTGLSTKTPQHFTVLSRDQAGNSASAPDGLL